MEVRFCVPDPAPTLVGGFRLAVRLFALNTPLKPHVEPIDGGYSVQFRPGWFQTDNEEARTACQRAMEQFLGQTKKASSSLLAKMPPLDMDCFSQCLDREPQIRLAYESLLASSRSGWEDRTHLLFTGDPAAAKSRIITGFTKLVGAEHVWKVYLTGSSERGLSNQLLERAQAGTLPRILVCEEIEKAKPSVLGCLLPLLGEEGLIQRTRSTDAPSVAVQIVCLATCNNLPLLARKLDGALLSRFFALPCEQPDRQLLTRILRAHAIEFGYDPGIVPYVVKFMCDDLCRRDPRLGKALLSGGNRWLDGSYRADLRRVYHV